MKYSISIGIVTVCYNDLNGLKKTINSVLSQNYKNYEHIIIDGNSNDGTKSFLNELDSSIIWSSEPDFGIYDAMNKGIEKCSSDFIVFMNSGDTFFDENTLYLVASSARLNTNIIYGDSISDYGYKKVLRKASDVHLFKSGCFLKMGFSHQAVYVSKNIYSKKRFDLNYKVASDFDFMYQPLIICSNDKSIVRINMPVCFFNTGGVSDLNKLAAIKDKIEIINRNSNCSFFKYLFVNFKMFFFYFLEIFKSRFRLRFRKYESRFKKDVR